MGRPRRVLEGRGWAWSRCAARLCPWRVQQLCVWSPQLLPAAQLVGIRRCLWEGIGIFLVTQNGKRLVTRFLAVSSSYLFTPFFCYGIVGVLCSGWRPSADTLWRIVSPVCGLTFLK